MDNLGREIRKEIEKIYGNPRRLKKLQEDRKKLLLHLEKIKKLNSDVKEKIITI